VPGGRGVYRRPPPRPERRHLPAPVSLHRGPSAPPPFPGCERLAELPPADRPWRSTRYPSRASARPQGGRLQAPGPPAKPVDRPIGQCLQ
jgi:hypothetical protein